MKKTIIALMALGSVAAAYEVGTEFSLDTTFSVDGDSASVILPAMSGDETWIELNQLHHSTSTTLTLDKLASSYVLTQLQPGQTLAVTSIQIVSRANTANRPADAKITLSSGDKTLAISDVADYSALGTAAYDTTVIPRGLITFNFAQPVDINELSTLTVSVSGDFGYTCVAGKDTISTLESDTATYGKWHMPVRLNTVVTPEPATATLSLLALAGLAARRRRH